MSDVSVEQLKDLVDPTALVLALGFKVYYDNQDEIRAPCIIHGGDNRTAFCFRKSVKRFYCFTHGCERDQTGEVNNDVISLVMRVKGCGFKEAVKFLSQLTGYNVEFGSVDEEEAIKIKKDRDIVKFVGGVLKVHNLDEVDEDIVKQYINNGCTYFRNMDFKKSVLDFFEVGTMVDDFGVERATIPIRDEFGRLVSISGRRTDGDGEPRYRLVKNFKKAQVLYGLNAALEYKDLYSRKIIIVEGFKALWRVVGCGFPNVAAVMGKSISQEQINLLVKQGFTCVLLLLDGDEPGRLGMERSNALLSGKIDTRLLYISDGMSPDDIGYEELFDFISTFL